MKTLGIFCILIIVGCQTGPSTLYQRKLEEIRSNVLCSKEAVVIIPNGGCEGCTETLISKIKSDETFFNTHFVVFTAIADIKLLKIQVGDSIIGRNDIYIDSSNNFSTPDIASIYPRVLKLAGCKVVSISSINK